MCCPQRNPIGKNQVKSDGLSSEENIGGFGGGEHAPPHIPVCLRKEGRKGWKGIDERKKEIMHEEIDSNSHFRCFIDIFGGSLLDPYSA